MSLSRTQTSRLQLIFKFRRATTAELAAASRIGWSANAGVLPEGDNAEEVSVFASQSLTPCFGSHAGGFDSRNWSGHGGSGWRLGGRAALSRHGRRGGWRADLPRLSAARQPIPAHRDECRSSIEWFRVRLRVVGGRAQEPPPRFLEHDRQLDLASLTTTASAMQRCTFHDQRRTGSVPQIVTADS